MQVTNPEDLSQQASGDTSSQQASGDTTPRLANGEAAQPAPAPHEAQVVPVAAQQPPAPEEAQGPPVAAQPAADQDQAEQIPAVRLSSGAVALTLSKLQQRGSSLQRTLFLTHIRLSRAITLACLNMRVL